MTTNVVGTQVLLDAMREHPVERFILISSSEVYGTAESEPMTEDHPLNPRSPYAGTKAGGDRLAYSYWCTYDLPITIIRPFNNYGPFQHPEKVIPRFIIQALTDRPLTIHGERHRQPRLAARLRHRRGDHGGLRGAARRHRRRDDQRRDRRRRVGRGDRRRDPRDPRASPRSLKQHVTDRPGQVDRHIGSTGKAARAARAGARASRSPTASSAPSAGTATIRTGGSRSWPRRRRPSPSCDRGPHARRARWRAGAAARHRRRARARRAHDSSATPTPASATSPCRARTSDGVRAAAAGAAGLIAPGTDWPVRIAAAVARDLGLPHPIGPDVAVVATDKIAQREPSTPPACRSRRGRQASRRRTRASSRRPTARGSGRCRSSPTRPISTRQRERAKAGSRSGRVIFEAFVPGPEVTVNGFTTEGRGVAAAVNDRVHFPDAPGVARRHVYPPDRDPCRRGRHRHRGRSRRSGSRPARGYVQMILGPDGPRVVEVAARLGGGHDSELVKLHDGRRPGAGGGAGGAGPARGAR